MELVTVRLELQLILRLHCEAGALHSRGWAFLINDLSFYDGMIFCNLTIMIPIPTRKKSSFFFLLLYHSLFPFLSSSYSTVSFSFQRSFLVLPQDLKVDLINYFNDVS
jgi:hypothetical protein